MTAMKTLDAYGELVEPATLKLERRLPGPIGRVWAHVTESELRRRWLAAGDMVLTPGASFELVWRNDELTEPPGKRPEGFGKEHRMQSRIVAVEPPRRLVFTWGTGSEVSIQLEAQGEEVLLTLVHRRVVERVALLNVSAGWHAHLDLLCARLGGQAPQPHWDRWSRLREEYEARMPD